MQRLVIAWEIGPEGYDTVYRYCPACGRKVSFKDSLKRRRNANGKNIYEYVIYKCERGHTWNNLIKTYQAKQYVETQESDNLTANTVRAVDIFSIEDCLQEGYCRD